MPNDLLTQIANNQSRNATHASLVKAFKKAGATVVDQTAYGTTIAFNGNRAHIHNTITRAKQSNRPPARAITRDIVDLAVEILAQREQAIASPG